MHGISEKKTREKEKKSKRIDLGKTKTREQFTKHVQCHTAFLYYQLNTKKVKSYIYFSKICLFSFIWRASAIKCSIMYNKSNSTFYYQFTGNLGIFYCRGTYIFIVRITISKKADATIDT